MRICTAHLLHRRLCASGTIIRCDTCGITWHVAQDTTSTGRPRLYSKFTYHRKLRGTTSHKGRNITV